MKKILIGSILILFTISPIVLLNSCKKAEIDPAYKKEAVKTIEAIPTIDSAKIGDFFLKHPDFKQYKTQVFDLYSKNKYLFIWYDKDGRKKVADDLFENIRTIEEEGIQKPVPYKSQLYSVFNQKKSKIDVDGELLFSTYYYFYNRKVILGLDDAMLEELEWFIPRENSKSSDSIFVNPTVLKKSKQHIEQYYKLKSALQKYRLIAKNGGWKTIEIPENFKKLNPKDSSKTVAQIRTRLFLTGEISEDNKSAVYDETLQKGVVAFKKYNGFNPDVVLLEKHIQEMNVPVNERIETILINMERCRWLPSSFSQTNDYILVNIPSYTLSYYKKGNLALSSEVVVGNELNKTVVFKGMLKYIVFCPYWNVPKSIIQNEILPAIEKNKNYLEEKNMEWNDGNVRQKPGANNALGLVKFIFPNSNNIYLHDTPSKSLFKEEKRNFSHGCIRVAKPIELANALLENENNWIPENTTAVIEKGEESWVTLKTQIPVYIGYFTAWVDDDGNVNFYKDVYERDKSLETKLEE